MTGSAAVRSTCRRESLSEHCDAAGFNSLTPVSNESERQAREAVAAYHEARLAELIGHVGKAVYRICGGELDAFETRCDGRTSVHPRKAATADDGAMRSGAGRPHWTPMANGGGVAPRHPAAFYAPGMSADSEASRRLRQAYEEAWAARTDSGGSEEVLRARLSAHQLSEVLDETTPIHGFIFDLWRRDVPPQRVSREVWKATGQVALHLLTTGRTLLRTFRPAGSDEAEAMDEQTDLEEMPEDKEGVLDNCEHPVSASLTFEPAEGAEPLLSQYAELTGRRNAWHQSSVWFDMQPDQPRASVLLGSTVIGQAAVPVEIWRAMRDLASEDLYADGFLDFRIRNDLLETGTLVCYYPAD